MAFGFAVSMHKERGKAVGHGFRSHGEVRPREDSDLTGDRGSSEQELQCPLFKGPFAPLQHARVQLSEITGHVLSGSGTLGRATLVRGLPKHLVKRGAQAGPQRNEVRGVPCS